MAIGAITASHRQEHTRDGNTNNYDSARTKPTEPKGYSLTSHYNNSLPQNRGDGTSTGWWPMSIMTDDVRRARTWQSHTLGCGSHSPSHPRPPAPALPHDPYCAFKHNPVVHEKKCSYVHSKWHIKRELVISCTDLVHMPPSSRFTSRGS